MGATEDATFRVGLETRQADKGLDDLRARTKTLGGGLDGLEKSVGKFQQTTLKSAAVVGQLGSVMGVAGGQAGKLLGITGNLAGSFAQGGVFGLAIAAVTAGVGLAADHFDLFGKKAEAAAKKATEHFDDLKGEIRDLDLALQAMASGTTIQRIKQQAIVAEKELLARQAIEAVGGAERFARLAEYERQGITVPQQIKKAYDEAIVATKDFALENEKLVKTIRNAQLEQHLKDVADATKPTGSSSSTRAGSRTSTTAATRDVYGYGDGSASESAAGLATGLALQEVKAAERTEQAKLEAQRMASDDRLAIAKTEHAEKMRLMAEEAAASKAQQEQISAVAVSLAAMTGRLAAGAMAGQQEAFDTFIAAASDMAGGFMMLEGGKLAAAGVTSLGLGNALGALQLAGGLALVGGGAAVQAGGPAAVASVLSGLGIATKATSRGGGFEPGVNRGGGSRVAGGGGGNRGGGSINFYYGVTGPQPDQTVRLIANAQTRAYDRGFIDDAIVVRR